jgi:hypothetical protein
MHTAIFEIRIDETTAEPLVVIQLESPTAGGRAEDILSIDGNDIAFVGENDLSSALNPPIETDYLTV